MKKFFDGLLGTEEELLDKLKRFVKENLFSIIAGVVIAVAGVGGWRFYQDYQHNYQLEARQLFLKITDQPQNAQSAFERLVTDYNNSSYVAFGRLMMAKTLYNNQQYQQSIEQLTELLDHEDNAIIHTARLRIAAIYIEQKQYQKALQTLNVVDQSSFIGQYETLKGDIYFFENNKALARQHYQNALKNTSDQTMVAVLQLKIDNLY